jgi:hypothetical protein
VNKHNNKIVEYKNFMTISFLRIFFYVVYYKKIKRKRQ